MDQTQIQELEQMYLNTLKQNQLELVNLDHLLSRQTRVGDTDDLWDEEVLMKIRSRKILYIKKLKATLKSLKREDFGECRECGAEIGMERLKARPTASLCVHCKEEEENREHHVLYSQKSSTIGRAIFNGTSDLGALALEEGGLDHPQMRKSSQSLSLRLVNS